MLGKIYIKAQLIYLSNKNNIHEVLVFHCCFKWALDAVAHLFLVKCVVWDFVCRWAIRTAELAIMLGKIYIKAQLLYLSNKNNLHEVLVFHCCFKRALDAVSER